MRKTEQHWLRTLRDAVQRDLIPHATAQDYQRIQAYIANRFGWRINR